MCRRGVARTLAWCALGGLAVLQVARLPPLVMPSTVGNHETAGHPYLEQDGTGAWSLCVSSRSGTLLPPFLIPDSPTTGPPAYTPGAAPSGVSARGVP